MTDDSTPRFDPRFDPAFQPGYEPDGGSPGVGTAANSGRYPKRSAPPPVGQAAAPRVSLTTGDASYAASSSASGFDPSPVRARPRYSSTPTNAMANAPANTPPHTAPSPQPPAAVAPVPLPAQFDSGFDEPDPRSAADSEASAQQLLRNPFLVALSILAVVFVAVGAWLFNRSYEAYNDAGNFASQGDFVAVESAINVAPLFVLFGAAIAVGVLFVFAIRWRRP